MNVLEIRNINKTFFDKKVLDNISFSVKAGEIFGLIGLNGVGKTTIIKIILDLLKADGGECFVCEKINTNHDSRQNIFYLPERFQPSQNLKVIEFFEIFVNSNTIDRVKLENLCEDLSLSKSVLNKKIGSLSKGMVQKVGLVASVMEDKRLLILDEPMSGLDPMARTYLKNILLNYKNKKNSIFFSSHILSDIDEICDRIAILDNSTIKFIGAPNEFKKNHNETSLEKAFLKEIKG
jgi:ABC-2 type transport system ATP-binding protein